MSESMSYFGSKNALYQRLINLIPRHRIYVEAFAGSAAVGRHLRMSETRIFTERDPDQVDWLRAHLPSSDAIHCEDVLTSGRLPLVLSMPDAFVFLDPPYPIGDRRDKRPRYRFEMTDDEHKQLAGMVYAARAKVMICGFPWGLYAGLYDGVSPWVRHDFEAIQRNGQMGAEAVWCNYSDPFPLHDYGYLGDDRKKRQDAARLVSRTVEKLQRLDRHRRQAVLDAINNAFPSTAGETACPRGSADLPAAADSPTPTE